MAPLGLLKAPDPIGSGAPGATSFLFPYSGTSNYERVSFDYTFDVIRVCFCDFVADVRVTVVGGVITGVADIATGDALGPDLMKEFRTINGLFDLVQDAYNRNAHEVQVEFDSSRGYPTRIWIDYVLMIADEEMGFTLLSEVKALGG